MWVITVFLDENTTTMYEFETEEEARNALKKIKGCKILSEIVCSTETELALVVH